MRSQRGGAVIARGPERFISAKPKSQTSFAALWALLSIVIGTIVISVLSKGGRELLSIWTSKPYSIAPLNKVWIAENIRVVGTSPDDYPWESRGIFVGANRSDGRHSALKFDEVTSIDHGNLNVRTGFDRHRSQEMPLRSVFVGELYRTRFLAQCHCFPVDIGSHVLRGSAAGISPSWLNGEVGGNQSILQFSRPRFLTLPKVILARSFRIFARKQDGIEAIDRYEGAQSSGELLAGQFNLRSEKDGLPNEDDGGRESYEREDAGGNSSPVLSSEPPIGRRLFDLFFIGLPGFLLLFWSAVFLDDRRPMHPEDRRSFLSYALMAIGFLAFAGSLFLAWAIQFRWSWDWWL